MKKEQSYDIFDVGMDTNKVIVFENGEGGTIIDGDEFDDEIAYLNSLSEDERRQIATEEGLI